MRWLFWDLVFLVWEWQTHISSLMVYFCSSGCFGNRADNQKVWKTSRSSNIFPTADINRVIMVCFQVGNFTTKVLWSVPRNFAGLWNAESLQMHLICLLLHYVYVSIFCHIRRPCGYSRGTLGLFYKSPQSPRIPIKVPHAAGMGKYREYIGTASTWPSYGI